MDKTPAKNMLKNNNYPKNLDYKYKTQSRIAMFLTWVSFYLYLNYKNVYFLYIIVAVTFIHFLFNLRKPDHSLKALLVFWGLIAIGFIVILLLFQVLLLIPLYI